MLPQDGTAAEADPFGDHVDREIRVLQQMLRGQHPLIAEPPGRGGPGLGLELRANVRGDMLALAATAVTDRSRARCSVIQSSNGPRVSIVVDGSGIATYCA